ncbi:hypothetical protein OUZ56_031972 [Daphnia magna]|uniref:Uncharacterized protein n=1 Tax=Daphnia magna TaxID=35525 RepID=A0ABQ9ZVS6_9CRUS|nr:hypothetical protein OUZ56_031972 [Daphnia magna]
MFSVTERNDEGRNREQKRNDSNGDHVSLQTIPFSSEQRTCTLARAKVEHKEKRKKKTSGKKRDKKLMDLVNCGGERSLSIVWKTSDSNWRDSVSVTAKTVIIMRVISSSKLFFAALTTTTTTTTR